MREARSSGKALLAGTGAAAETCPPHPRAVAAAQGWTVAGAGTAAIVTIPESAAVEEAPELDAQTLQRFGGYILHMEAA